MTKYEKLILKIQIINTIFEKYNIHYHIDHEKDYTPVLWKTTDEGIDRVADGIENIDYHMTIMFGFQTVLNQVTDMLKARIF